MKKNDFLTVGMAQIAPIWLNKSATTRKICKSIQEAAIQGCELLVFGEALLPGYPFWLSFTNGSEFNSKVQKEIHAYYIKASIQIEKGDLDEICALAKEHQMAIYLGIMERAQNRGGHSLYCSLVYIDTKGVIQSVHRKLQPTYEERLCWSPGDGNGLQVHPLKSFHLGGLNCWENWMPLSRTALYGMGENVHIAVWPGAVRNTIDITRFIALESRSYVISVCSLFNKDHITDDIPHSTYMSENAPALIADGGSCIAKPNGEWLIEPIKDKEGIFFAELDLNLILEERQNFDPAGHYSRPDITKLSVDTRRQSILDFIS